ncbi:MAG: DMT family transporter [Clostridiales bacterium]|nr:DMT family transporter [Clostridiales bacterium]
MMLILTAIIWGSAFVAQRAGIKYLGPFTFNGIRSFIGFLVLIPVILIIDYRNRKKNISEGILPQAEIDKKYESKSLVLGGLLCGIVLFAASSLQQVALVYTTAGKAGFITALYIVIVPILGLFMYKKVRAILWLSVALAVFGLYLLCIKESFTMGKGDILVIISAFVYAIHILVIDHFSQKVDCIKMSCLQFLICGIFSLPLMMVMETFTWQDILRSSIPILYTGVISCGVAYTLQMVGQKYTEPTVASLILSLEAVFALIAGILILNEHISQREIIGCIIMFAAILIAQLPSKEEIS